MRIDTNEFRYCEDCHPRVGRDPSICNTYFSMKALSDKWIPACAGMTLEAYTGMTLEAYARMTIAGMTAVGQNSC